MSSCRWALQHRDRSIPRPLVTAYRFQRFLSLALLQGLAPRHDWLTTLARMEESVLDLRVLNLSGNPLTDAHLGQSEHALSVRDASMRTVLPHSAPGASAAQVCATAKARPRTLFSCRSDFFATTTQLRQEVYDR